MGVIADKDYDSDYTIWPSLPYMSRLTLELPQESTEGDEELLITLIRRYPKLLPQLLRLALNATLDELNNHGR